MNFRQEVEICIQKLSTDSLHHLLSNLQSESHLIVNDLHRMFLEKSKSMSLQQHQMRACSSRNFDKCSLKSSDRFIQTRVTSYLNATISFAFETIEFEIFKSTHARESLSRQFSILIHVSRFSKISHSSSICKRRQEHFVTHLFSNCFTSSASRIEKIFILKKYWFEEVTKVVCFSNFSLVIFLLWESHYLKEF